MGFLRKIINIGIEKNLPPDEAVRVRLSNIFSLCTLPIMIIYIPYGIAFRSPVTVIMATVLILGIFAGIYLNHRRRYTAAKMLIFLLDSLAIFITHNSFNVSFSTICLFFPLLYAFVTFYDFKTERRALLPTLAVTVLFIIACFTVPSYSIVKIILDDQAVVISHVVNYFFSFALSLIFIFLNARSQRLLNEGLVASMDAAVKASNAKSVFLSTISHELRTPLNGIIGAASLLPEEKNEAARSQYHEVLQYSAGNMLQIINDVLDYSKVEAGKLTMEKRRFNLYETLEKIYGSFEKQAAAKGLQLVKKYDYRLNTGVESDELRISQILSNLLSNAIKFTETGSITIRAWLKHSDAAVMTVHFSVSDTGIGIDKEHTELIFHSFTQAESGTTRKYGGTGLGLTICRELVQLFGGVLKVDSEPGRGSNFYFEMPLTVTAGRPPAATTEAAPQPHAKLHLHILIADDNSMNSFVISSFLKKWGATCHTVSDGEQAVTAFGEQAFDMVLLDLSMPVMDGYQALPAIRGKNPQVPVLAFTAAVYENMASDLAMKGFDGFITKPFKPAEVHEKIMAHTKLQAG